MTRQAYVGGWKCPCLASVGKRLVMHVFVEDGEQRKVNGFRMGVVRGVGFEVFENAVAHGVDVGERLRAWGQRQTPTSVVRYGGGVVQCIGVIKDWTSGKDMTQDPFFLEPCDVADLPEQRVEDGKLWAEQLLIGEIGDKLEGTLSGVVDPVAELRERRKVVWDPGALDVGSRFQVHKAL